MTYYKKETSTHETWVFKYDGENYFGVGATDLGIIWKGQIDSTKGDSLKTGATEITKREFLIAQSSDVVCGIIGGVPPIRI